MSYYAGIDGGATKTHAVLTDGEGNLLWEVTGGSSNYQTAGPRQAAANLAQVLQLLSARAGIEPTAIRRVAGGFAGLDGPADREPVAQLVTEALRRAGILSPWIALNDSTIAWAGALDGAPGAIVISGTGAIAFAVNRRGHSARSDGWGHWVGDEGSGFDIGRRGLTAAVRALDGRGPDTALVSALEAYARGEGLPDWQAWIGHLTGDHTGAHGRVAAFARSVAAAADAGDGPAREILETAGASLAATVHSALIRTHQADQAVPVAGLGSVLLHNPTVKAAFARELRQRCPGVRLQDPRHSPGAGAALLARHPDRLPTDTVQVLSA